MTVLVYRTPKNGDWRIARLENFEGSLPAVLKYINELEKTEVETKPKPYPIIEETLTHEDDPQLPY